MLLLYSHLFCCFTEVLKDVERSQTWLRKVGTLSKELPQARKADVRGMGMRWDAKWSRQYSYTVDLWQTRSQN